MRRLTFAWLLCLGLSATCLNAQELTCGTKNPEKLSQADLQFAQLAQERANKANGGTVRVIPVAVHVIYSIEPNDPHNISQDQIDSQIEQLNADFSGQSGGVDTEIRFCLAGINRVLLPNLINIESSTNAPILKDSVQADPNLFLNVWVVNSVTENGSFVYGYSTYPQQLGTAPQLDGIVVRSFFFGSRGNIATGDDYNMGRTMVHEVGHWLSLLHVFQNGCDNASNCATEGDCCCDTPPQEAELRKCRTLKNTCHGDNPDKKDPVHNFMGYSDDQCRTEFTECQKARIQLCLDSMRPTAWFLEGGDCPPLRMRPKLARNLQVLAYPNPFSNNTKLKVEIIGKETPITIQVFDAQGRMVAQIADRQLFPIGHHEYQFEAPAPGIYLARVSSPWHTKSIRLVSTAR
jgi:hypothetical protein